MSPSEPNDVPYQPYPQSIVSTYEDPQHRLSAVAEAIRDTEVLLDQYKDIRKATIIELREQGLSQAKIGELAGVDPSMVSRIARGERR